MPTRRSAFRNSAKQGRVSLGLRSRSQVVGRAFRKQVVEENPCASPRSEHAKISPRRLPEILGCLFAVRNWRLAALGGVLIAAFATPADPLSLLLAAIPMFAIYLAIAGSLAWFGRRRAANASVKQQPTS